MTQFLAFRDRLESFSPKADKVRYSAFFHPSAEEARSAMEVAEQVAEEGRRILARG
jgi:hypothetical protein